MTDQSLPAHAEAAWRLAAIVDSSDDAIISKTLDGIITSWNPAAERIFGYASAEAVGQHITLIIPDERRAEEDEVLARIRAGLRVDHFETVRVAKNGQRVEVSITVSPMKDADGRIVGASKVARDVTGRHQSEFSQARLAAIVESSDDAIISKTLEGVITSWNGGAERMFGYTAAEAVGQHITLIIPEARRAEEDYVLAQLRRGERLTHFETVRQRKDGHLLEISLTVSPIRNAKGDIVGASKIARDISERQVFEQARQALLEREQAARAEAEVLAELARSMNTAHDVETVLQRVVDGAKELCGCDLTSVAMRETESGAVVMRNRAGEYRGAPERLVIEPGKGAGGLVLDSGQPFRSDNMAQDSRITPDYAHVIATEGLVATLIVPIMVEGRVEGLLYVHRRTPRPFTDRTETILRLLAEYASIAIHNMRLLAHEHQMRAEAEGASRMKDEFLATLSHELRSPLQPLLNWAYLLRSPNLDPASAARALDAIERSTKSLGQLIEDLLDVSRIVTGKLRLQARPMRLAGVVRAALEAVEAAALAKSVTLEAQLAPDLPAVLGDPERLQQVLWNLLSNGIKFTPRGGRVTVSLAGHHSEVLITVADTGAGIKREFLPHVFERFRQAESGTNRAYGGLGLGLAIVRHLVELHGGTVSVQSDGEGSGATFSVRLPVAVAARVPAERAPAVVASDAPVAGSLSGLRILVVDDGADAREVMRFMLERGGARVRAADSAAQALDAIREDPPDLLISDIGMPEEDGYVMVRRLRAMEEGVRRRLPSIALTAYAGEEDARRARAAGFDAHLSKPVDLARLIEIAVGLTGSRPDD